MRKGKKLTTYFIWSIVVSLVAMLASVNVMLKLTYPFTTNIQFEDFISSKLGNVVLISVALLYILLLLGVFIGVFILMVNRKVKYIRYISEEVKNIELNGFGQTMEVRGQDELAQLSEGINTMSVKLKEKQEKERQIENAKNELITNVSHDLRTPLTSIIGYVSLLKQNGFHDKEQFEEYTSVIERRLQGLNSMINELFEYTKLNASEITLSLEPIDFIALLQHLVYEYTVIYLNNGLSLEAQIDLDHCMIKADVEKIIRVLQNLLDNAKKYAVPESVIRLYAYKEKEEVVVRLDNRTKQLKEEEIHRVFERFYKGDTSRTETNSSGLGLSIVKRIVELHHGEIMAAMEGDVISFQLRIPTIDKK
ncbi:MAG: HAMP domain-containing sensor histidine kinase [bacterium]|nr:HAMP domain-containing sensor histidine kinase [bacterium]